MHRPLSAFAVLAVVATVAWPAPSVTQGRERTKAGTLTCDISGGIGLIVTSKKEVACMFTPSQPGPREVYTGSISKFGLDLGATAGGEMVWTVYAPITRRVGALAGHYGGAGPEPKVGANILIGGSNHTVTLRPISVQGQAGLNLAAGVAGLELRPAR
jgi:hypothetical protein